MVETLSSNQLQPVVSTYLLLAMIESPMSCAQDAHLSHFEVPTGQDFDAIYVAKISVPIHKYLATSK